MPWVSDKIGEGIGFTIDKLYKKSHLLSVNRWLLKKEMNPQKITLLLPSVRAISIPLRTATFRTKTSSSCIDLLNSIEKLFYNIPNNLFCEIFPYPPLCIFTILFSRHIHQCQRIFLRRKMLHLNSGN